MILQQEMKERKLINLQQLEKFQNFFVKIVSKTTITSRRSRKEKDVKFVLFQAKVERRVEVSPIPTMLSVPLMQIWLIIYHWIGYDVQITKLSYVVDMYHQR